MNCVRFALKMGYLKTHGGDEMSELLTAAQMRAIERTAIESGDVSGLELMERAGRGVVEAVFAAWPELQAGPHRTLVLCGPGNNGGDGFVVARLLRACGWAVDLFLFGDPDKLPPDARTTYDRWSALGAVQIWHDDAVAERLRLGDYDLAVDALFGTGCTRGIGGIARKTAQALVDFGRARGGHAVAVDLPSGLCSDSGRDLGAAFPASLTVSFHRAKLGHYLADGSALCGRVVVADIGLSGTAADAVALIDAPARPVLDKGSLPATHKYSHGHLLVLSGGFARTGAARLAARAGLRAGAGLVTVAAPGEAMAECACQLTAIMLRHCEDAPALAQLLEDPRLNVVCLGPGLGTGAREAALVRAVLESGRRAVLDADALTLIARDETLAAALHRDCVLTPHAGEFARLFPDNAARLAAPAEQGPAWSRAEAARDAADRTGAVVLLKGPDTVIAAPDGRCGVHAALYERAAPWLATGGSGDVLAGIIAGLMARGIPAMQAAAAGAWLHVEAARSFGPGLIAEDLPERLPEVLRELMV